MTPAGVARYRALGLAKDRHVPGLVDSYYRPKRIAARVGASPLMAPEHVVAEARSILAASDAGEPLGDPDARAAPGHWQHEIAPDAGRDASRRHYLRAQTIGLLTTARNLAAEPITGADEVEACYGVRPRRFE